MNTKLPPEKTSEHIKHFIKDNSACHAKPRKEKSKKTKLLLACVFKPYGVDDEYGDALCSMELLNNQVTREQGIHSPRSNNLSFALYMLAENINVETTVVDFPSWSDFAREVDKGEYTHIGITFISQNILRAKRMVTYIREHSPDTKIILGGHGTAIPELDELIDYDEVCRGEGVAWLREYFGEDIHKPIIHPAVQTSVKSFVYGAPILEKAGTIFPGVGCKNGCRFCATSHKFNKTYTAFLKNGKDIYNACKKQEKELKVTDFGVMDENFCQNDTTARQLLMEMEKNKKAYTFSIFSSAEAITRLGVDFLVRMGVTLVWIGIESKANIFEKTQGIDLNALITTLQDNGITVLASTILFLEHHDKRTIHEDIDWAIGLKSDLLQFMQFGPIPGTPLFNDYAAQEKLLHDEPWQSRHGQDKIWFKHTAFNQSESKEYLINAFVKKYETHGPSILNMAHTAVKGYIAMKKKIQDNAIDMMQWDPHTLKYRKNFNYESDEFMVLRLKAMEKNALKFRPLLHTMQKYAPNEEARQKCKLVIEIYNKTFGKQGVKTKILGFVVKTTAILENYRFKKNGVIMRQPTFLRKKYKDRVKQKANQ